MDSDLFRRVEFPRFRRSTEANPNTPRVFEKPVGYTNSEESPLPDFKSSEPPPYNPKYSEPLPPYSKNDPLSTAPADDKHRGNLALGAAAGLGIGTGVAGVAGYNALNNNTRRTFEAFEGRVNAELVERALGGHDLDK